MKKIFILLASLMSFNLILFAKPIISVSIPPQAFFVKKIAGDFAEINVIVPPNTDEHNIDFKPATISKLEKSDIYFTTGLEFEKPMMHKFQSLFKHLEIVDLRKNIKLLGFAEHSHEAHSHKKHEHQNDENPSAHHEAHSHAHESSDPHIWLDPILVKTQASTIANTLSAKYPQERVKFQTNLEKFNKELDALNVKIAALLKDKAGKKFIVYHPSWGYFAARYNLVQIPVELEGKEPKARDLKALIEMAKKEKIKTIFVQKGFAQNAARALTKELDAQVLEIDHLSADWENELLKSAEILSKN